MHNAADCQRFEGSAGLFRATAGLLAPNQSSAPREGVGPQWTIPARLLQAEEALKHLKPEFPVEAQARQPLSSQTWLPE